MIRENRPEAMSQSATNRGAPRNPSSPSLRWAIPLIFLLSGACGLAYQVVWARMLIVVFGTTLLAVSTVLSVFMAGLALGSFSFGRWIDHVHRPLRVFACLEAGIGLFAFLFPQLLPVTRMARRRPTTRGGSLTGIFDRALRARLRAVADSNRVHGRHPACDFEVRRETVRQARKQRRSALRRQHPRRRRRHRGRHLRPHGSAGTAGQQLRRGMRQSVRSCAGLLGRRPRVYRGDRRRSQSVRPPD